MSNGSSLTRRGLVKAALAVAATTPGLARAASGESAPRAADRPADPAVLCGGARTIRLKNGFNVWVKHVGPTGGTSIPVLTLHGGPGFPHFYFECFEDFLPRNGISYWYYDQLGCGFSDQPNDSKLWNLERFKAEVEEVREALQLERLVLFGHSWGGMLAMEYALQHPERLAGLVISNMTASTARYETHLQKLRGALPAEQLARLQAIEKSQAYDSPEYEALLAPLYNEHICRLDPWPEPVSRAVKWLSAPVYNTIQGKSEFEVTGNMKGWDRWADLSRIQTPTLLLGGRHDEIDPQDMREMGRRIPHARTFICPNGSHLGMYDDQQAYFAELLPFLRRVSRVAA